MARLLVFAPASKVLAFQFSSVHLEILDESSLSVYALSVNGEALVSGEKIVEQINALFYRAMLAHYEWIPQMSTTINLNRILWHSPSLCPSQLNTAGHNQRFNRDAIN
jgi:hypothetical protein